MNPRTTFAVLEETAARCGATHALHQPEAGGYRVYSWTEFRDAAREIACGLRGLGVVKGDIVALASETRAEFYLADLGVMANGSIAAALYTSYPPAEQARSLATSDAKVVFVENPKTMRTLLAAGARDLPVRWITLTGHEPGTTTLDEVRAAGREAMARDSQFFAQIQAQYTPDDHAILYLTSGATGEPKMGLVTHNALVSNIDMGPAVLPLRADDATIAFLPSAHIAQRVVVELLPIRCGSPVWFSESLSKLPAELRIVRPTWFLAPPRVWERIYSSICTEIKKRPAHVRRMFYTALGLGLEAARYKQQGKRVPVWLRAPLAAADRLVFRKIRDRFGGRLKIAASGAAPLGRDLAQFYGAIGMPLIEGYGLTEGGVVALNPIERPKPGSIGTLLPGIEIRIDADGELLVKSPCLFSGYYKDPASTAAVLRDGWLHTGDIAEMDDDGYIYITGRKKELIVSSNGKKIYPARIEALLKTEPLINYVVLIGDRLPYVTALLTLNTAAEQGGEAAEQVVRKAVAKANKQLPGFEQIRKFRILERDFTIADGELTPTMKVRRARVLENFRPQIAEMYAGRESALEE
jgi:long-chain acyl-CoA synthetase